MRKGNGVKNPARPGGSGSFYRDGTFNEVSLSVSASAALQHHLHPIASVPSLTDGRPSNAAVCGKRLARGQDPPHLRVHPADVYINIRRR